MKQHTIHPMDEIRVIRAEKAPLLFSYEQLLRALSVCQAYDESLKAQIHVAEAAEIAAAGEENPESPEGGDQDAETSEQGLDGQGQPSEGQSDFDRLGPPEEAHTDEGR